jgi:hypothetical protein
VPEQIEIQPFTGTLAFGGAAELFDVKLSCRNKICDGEGKVKRVHVFIL